MTEVARIRHEVAALSASDRAELAAFLLGGLEEAHYWVSDDEVARRREELDSGQCRGLTLAEFREACGR